MTAPALAGLAAFVVVPFGVAIWLSLNFVNLQSVLPPRWIGLQQYELLLVDPEFRAGFYRAVVNNGLFALLVVPTQTGLALALALLLNRPLRGIAVFRTIFFMPVVFPMALVATVWKLIYSPDELGMLNSVVRAITFGHAGPIDWLGNPHTALAAIAVMSVWQGAGFQMVIVLAGLQHIPEELHEAAAIDGASAWRRFRHVTLPGLRGTLVFVAAVTTMLAFQLFDQVYLLTQGGPGDATTTMVYQAVTDAFIENNVGQAAAVTVLFFVVVLAITLAQRRLSRGAR
jgi:multiple sugar transport system permease protein